MFTAVIRNIGTSGAQAASVVFKLMADGRQAAISQPVIFGIAGGGTFQASWTAPIPTARQMQVVVLVIANTDVNPANNQASLLFTVPPQTQPPRH